MMFRQTMLNNNFVMQRYGLPPLHVLYMEDDRTFYSCSGVPLIERIAALIPEAFSGWDLNQNHGPTAKMGWRENKAMYSLQIILHKGDIIECDIDWFNPNWGLGPLLLHGLTCLFVPKVDPFKAKRALEKRWNTRIL